MSFRSTFLMSRWRHNVATSAGSLPSGARKGAAVLRCRAAGNNELLIFEHVQPQRVVADAATLKRVNEDISNGRAAAFIPTKEATAGQTTLVSFKDSSIKDEDLKGLGSVSDLAKAVSDLQADSKTQSSEIEHLQSTTKKLQAVLEEEQSFLDAQGHIQNVQRASPYLFKKLLAYFLKYGSKDLKGLLNNTLKRRNGRLLLKAVPKDLSNLLYIYKKYTKLQPEIGGLVCAFALGQEPQLDPAFLFGMESASKFNSRNLEEHGSVADSHVWLEAHAKEHNGLAHLQPLEQTDMTAAVNALGIFGSTHMEEIAAADKKLKEAWKEHRGGEK